MYLTKEQQSMLDGEEGAGTQIAMEIIASLGKVYEADALIPVESCQVSGVSYKNIGEAGLDFLESLREGGARSRVLATLNPCGLDLGLWDVLGFDESFYKNQARVLDAYTSLGILQTCSCTPYLVNNNPSFGAHVAWSESSAVSYVNSVLGARTNREGGPAALSAAITGYTGNYGLHLEENRAPEVLVDVQLPLKTYGDFARLGLVLGSRLGQKIPVLRGLDGHGCTRENLRQLGASMAASGAIALYHVAGVTPEAGKYDSHEFLDGLETITIDKVDILFLPLLYC